MDVKEMRDVDPEKVDRETLVEFSDVIIPPRYTGEQRIMEYIKQIRNPYCYMDKKTLVKIGFSDTHKTLQGCMFEYMTWK